MSINSKKDSKLNYQAKKALSAGNGVRRRRMKPSTETTAFPPIRLSLDTSDRYDIILSREAEKQEQNSIFKKFLGAV